MAREFMPPAVIGWNEDVTTYEYDPEAAKALLAEAGYSEANPLTLQFNYPVNVSRPYMPNPEQIYTNLASQLEAVGIVLTPVGEDWNPTYLDRIQGGADHGMHLLGWTGDYNDPDNFVGTFFGQRGQRVGLHERGAVRRRSPRRAGFRARRSRRPPTSRSTSRSWSSCRASRWRTRCRRSPSPSA